jgi:transposase-like protein
VKSALLRFWHPFRRGCQDILIAVTDGLKGMSEALETAYPATTLQTCLVHVIRNSLDFVGWTERALRNITAEWTRPVHHGKAAMNQFAILYEDRFTRATF